jgi:aspartate racemase
MPTDKPHVGIVACSAEGAALCYRTLCLEGERIFGAHDHPDVSLHTHSLADYMHYIDAGDWRGVADLMFSSAEKLAQIGANILLCPDNTIHQAFDHVRPRSPRPWLHIAEVVVEQAKAGGAQRLGILGTKYLMEGPVYRESCARAGIEAQIPDHTARVEINRIIFDELVKGIVRDDSRRFLHRVIDELKTKHCDAVVLGCTEIPLIVDAGSSTLPTFDSTRLLARAALAWAARESGRSAPAH